MPRQTSIQITEATERQIEYLTMRGYGKMTDIVRIAIDRMYRDEVKAGVQPRQVAPNEDEDG